MKRMPSVLIYMILSCTLLSCSVKEDRNDCPCRLILDFRSMHEAVGSHVQLDFHTTDGYFHKTEIDLSQDSLFEFNVPRSKMIVNAYMGDDGFMSEDGLFIPMKNQCPAIYMNTLILDTRRESLKAEVMPYKNYCNIELCFEDPEQFRYSAAVRGDYCGYDIDGRVKKGLFIYKLYPDDKGKCQVRVPRQDDGSLTLTLRDMDGYEKNFALGEYIIASGFDWKRKNLKDIIVEIDYARTMVVFKIEDWKKTVSFDVII